MELSEQYLVESKTARENGISKLKLQSAEERILNKVKALVFAVWKGEGRISRKQLADFYEVSVSTIDSNYSRHDDEFKLDGVEVLQGGDLKEVRRIMRLTSSAPKETIYTSAGALRMGFILRDSEVAKTVRTVAIRIIQGVGQEVPSAIVLQSLTKSNPVLQPFTDPLINALPMSAPYAKAWEKMKAGFTKQYPDGGIPGMSAEDIRKAIQFCSTYTDTLKLQGIKELPFELGGALKGKYPSLTSDVFLFDLGGESGSAVLMFQISDTIINFEYVQECVGRGYIQVAKSGLSVDRAYLFFVAPFGATSYAKDYILNHLSDEYRGYVGVLTVKELAEALYQQAYGSRNLGTAKGEITREFSKLRNYEIPEPPQFFTQRSLFDT